MVKFVTNASGVIWWPKFAINASGATWWPNLDSMQVAFYLAGETTQVIDSIPWVRCASGNVFWGGVKKNQETIFNTLKVEKISLEIVCKGAQEV